jgi:hypothetical protein
MERNGGDTSRRGPGKVLLFNEGSGRYYKTWEAHMYVSHLNGNLYACGETFQVAYHRLIAMLHVTGLLDLVEEEYIWEPEPHFIEEQIRNGRKYGDFGFPPEDTNDQI